jgi:Cytochrome P450
MMTFFVAMLLYPDVQKQAQDEIDSVIGRDRLPTFEDRPKLPFVDAVCKEALRWHPLVPVGGLLPALRIGVALLLRHPLWQVSHMLSHKMTSMQASSYRRVSPNFSRNMLRCLPMRISQVR